MWQGAAVGTHGEAKVATGAGEYAQEQSSGGPAMVSFGHDRTTAKQRRFEGEEGESKEELTSSL